MLWVQSVNNNIVLVPIIHDIVMTKEQGLVPGELVHLWWKALTALAFLDFWLALCGFSFSELG